MAPIFFDAHTCSLPSTTDLIGREMGFDCRCGPALAPGALHRERRRAARTLLDLALIAASPLFMLTASTSWRRRGKAGQEVA